MKPSRVERLDRARRNFRGLYRGPVLTADDPTDDDETVSGFRSWMKPGLEPPQAPASDARFMPFARPDRALYGWKIFYRAST